MRPLKLLFLSLLLTLFVSPTLANICEISDNGTGTINLPPDCPNGYIGILSIIDGLPPGTTITGQAVLTDIFGQSTIPGGILGGEGHAFGATLHWTAEGTGELAGFTRQIAIPVDCEMHSAPRNPGDPIQTFATEMIFMQGQLFGDPDFCNLIFVAGTGFGLPSPGSTTLTEVPSGDFSVDSFFDVTYEIEFEGCPGSILEGLTGTTTATDRFQAGGPYVEPIDHNCQLTDNGTGTIDLPPECPDGYVGALTIIDGLPAGATITGEAVLRDIVVTSSGVGGALGGEFQIFDATLYWTATGTGDLTGFVRRLAIPVSCEAHTGPRNPGDPVQAFDNDMFLMQGQLFGDPDFCNLLIVAGSGNGLPSPGSTTITKLPTGDFAVDSFFDVTYEIEFEGCPGSILEGWVGRTVDTERFQAGEPYFEPIDHNCQLPDNGTGTVDLPPQCPDGYVGRLTIIDGLPAGSTITGEAVLKDISVTAQGLGGSLGGEFQEFDALVYWEATGTGALAGFARSIIIPVICEVHTGPRTLGATVQTFASDVISIQGQLYGDYDFCDLILDAGLSFGLPSPGSTTITKLPSNDFVVDSFFDLQYQITYDGCPSSPIEGVSGSTLDTQKFQAGEEYIASGVGGLVAAKLSILHQNSPNPFNPMTVIRYELPPSGGHVALDIFDLRGRHVCNLVDSVQSGGQKSVTWYGTDGQGRRTASGVYLYSLKTDRETLIRKMVILK